MSKWTNVETGTCICGCEDNPKLSAYQRAIIHFVNVEDGNAVVKATAGSGKTYTLREVSSVLPSTSKSVYLAFGRLNAQEAQGKFSISCSTFNSFCYKVVGKYVSSRTRVFPKTDGRNDDLILDSLFGKTVDEIRPAIIKLSAMAKGANLAPNAPDSDMLALIDQFDIDWDSPEFTVRDVLDCTRKLLTEASSRDGIARRKLIDFNDQLWLVERFNLKLDVQDFILVDEAQDTNVLQRAILKRLMGPHTRLIAVGDDCQAIYGFRGASSDALQQIVDDFSATILPLSISYRCSAAVVAKAQQYGIIEPSPTAIAGAVRTPDKVKLADVATMQLVLCRNTAPLITLAYRMLANRIPCLIRGRDIGNGLISLIRKLAGKRGTLETLYTRVEEYRTRETERAMQSRNESKAQSINDKCDSIIALADSMTSDEVARGIDGLVASINALFADREEKGKVTLSTMHKAKGLEAQHVGILDWQLCPSKYAKRADQIRQEVNLQFVAITRSLDVITFLDSERITE